MTDTPPPPRPADDPGASPTEPVGPTAPAETTSLHAGGVPTSGQPYPGPPPGGDWTPANAPRSGRLRQYGRRVRGSRLALAIIAVVVAAGLALGGFAIADGGHDGKGEGNGRATASQRDGNGGNGENGNANRGEGRNNNNAQDAEGNVSGNGNGSTTGSTQQVVGAVTAISSSSITVRTAGGTPSYALTAATPVTRGGSAASVADIKVGDAVVLHLVIASAGTAPVVERIAG